MVDFTIDRDDFPDGFLFSTTLRNFLRAPSGALSAIRGLGMHNLRPVCNCEWTLGDEHRFGLIPVDVETLEPSPKASYHALKRALEHAGE